MNSRAIPSLPAQGGIMEDQRDLACSGSIPLAGLQTSISDITAHSLSQSMGMMEAQEAEAVKRVLAGDRDAFRVLVDLHSRTIFRLAYRFMGNEQDAHDVVQETFLRAYAKLKNFKFEASLRSWLCRIANNYCIDLIKERRREAVVAVPAEEFDSIPVAGAGSMPDPERLAISNEAGRTVESAMRSLSGMERAAFVMRHFDGCSIREISEALKVSETSSKQFVFRAVRKIRMAVGTLMVGAAK
jgi:RNA polymerase sigma-70 factor, ECF subfamily